MGCRGRVHLAIAVALVFGGCLKSASPTCADGRVCPTGSVCVSFGCVLEGQITACNGLSDGAECVQPGDKTGECHDGACLSIGCGNGILEVGEACDDGNTLGGDGCSARCDSDETCGNAFLDAAKSEGCDCGGVDFTGTRPPGCNDKPNSDAADSICTSNCTLRGCGDGNIGPLEQCDGAALGGNACTDVGFYGGTLGCLPSCQFDVSSCTGRCGDGIRNGSPVELCDGSDLGATTCSTFGYYNSGGLACNQLCGFDTTNCSGYCGDNIYQSAHETCDPGESEAQLNARGLDCTDFGFYGPAGLKCSSSCQIDTSSCGGGYCGDGIKQAGEDCDMSALGGNTCMQFGYYAAGTLGCRSNCTFDFTGCASAGRCGDGTVNGPEDCDTTVAAGTDCTDFGYYTAGSVSCRANCTFDTAGCASAGRCGDGTINGTEQCDGNSNLAGKTCTDFNYYIAAGLKCSAGCTYDISSCSQKCGDGVINGSEECDGNGNLNGADCHTTFGFYNTPGLACNSRCSYDTSACTGFCGDNVVNGPEDCDGTPPATSCVDNGYDGGRVECSHFCTPDPAECDRFGWWSVTPPAPGVNFKAVGGTSHKDVWVLSSTKLYHYDGARWTASPDAPTAGVLNDLWVASPTDVWVAGTSGFIARFNGSTWTDISVGGTYTFNSIFGLSTTDVYVAGGISASNGSVLHYNGSVWGIIAAGFPTGISVLNGVWASSTSNVIAVGVNGSAVHWNGSTWAKMTTNGADLYAVWGTSSTNVYTVGENASILHSDGADEIWAAIYGGGSSSDIIRGIWGSSPNNIVTVGTTSDLFLHYDGAHWGTVSTHVDSAVDVWGSAADDVWAVGNGTSAHFEGHALKAIPTGTTADLVSVWSAAPADVFFGGGGGATATTILRYNGSSCTAMTISPASTELPGSMWGSSSSNVFAGGSGGSSWRYTGGASWTRIATPSTEGLTGMWGADPNNIFAVGLGGDVVKWNGSSWSLQRDHASGGLEQFKDVWGSSASNVYAVSYNHPVWKFDGAMWAATASPNIKANSIAGAGPSSVFVDRYRFTGTSWFDSALPMPGTINGQWAQNATSVFAVGDNGAISHYDGLGWLPIRSGTGNSLARVSGSGNTVHAVGAAGTAIQIESYCGTTEFRCSNEWDDDCDGLMNCADPDCATDPFCTAGGACKTSGTVVCGGSVSASNTGAAARIDEYGCAGSRSDTGPERMYKFVAAASQSVTVTVTKNAALDLVVLTGGASGACDPQGSCVGASFGATNSTADSVTFSATAGTTYYFVVDGNDRSAVAPFQLQVTCN